MTTNLHDKMLAAIDALFSASDAVEEEVAENLLLDVRDAINKHKLAAESLNEGLRLDDWDKIGCVNHDCDKCKAQQWPVAHSIVAGALFDFMGWLTSRKERLVLSWADEASPAVEAITEFANMRGLALDDAKVQDWNTTPQPPAQPLTSGKVVRLKDAFYAGFESYETPAASYSDVDEKWTEYAATHGITKGNT